MATLSVSVITLDDEGVLPRMLERVGGIADEVILVDSGSTDRTPEIARAAGVRFVEHPSPGPREQRAFALSLATGDYVLDLDADELIDADLATAIRAELNRPGGPLHAGYRIRLRHNCFGRQVRYGAMWRDLPVRLFLRAGARYGGSSNQPRPLVEGSLGDLPGRCDRDGFRNLAEARAELAREADQAARERFRSGHRAHLWDLLRWPLGFLGRYLLRLGFLDGMAGLQLALLYARRDLDEVVCLRRLHREIGGAGARGPWVFRIREAARKSAVALLSLLLPKPKRPVPPSPDIRKLLVVRTDERVGNQLLTTPLLRALREGLPHAEIHFLAPPRHASVVPHRLVNRLVPFEKRLAFRRPWQFVSRIVALRREGYDAVIEAAHWSGLSLTSSLLARVVGGSGPIVGHSRGGSERFLSHPVTHDPANENEVLAKLELLRPLGILPCGLHPETDLGRQTGPAQAILSSLGLLRPYAVLNPGARRGDRRWPPASHGAVAAGLAKRGFPVIVVWGPGEEQLARAVTEASGARLAPPTTLEELAALLREAHICVSNNSGPMHLSMAVGTPTVGVFLSGDAGRWGHLLPGFEAAAPNGDADAATILRACDRLISSGAHPPRGR